MDSLRLYREAVTRKVQVEALKKDGTAAENAQDAQTLRIPPIEDITTEPTDIDMDEKTSFNSKLRGGDQIQAINMRSVYNVMVSSNYHQSCGGNVVELAFLDKTKLVTWLQGGAELEGLDGGDDKSAAKLGEDNKTKDGKKQLREVDAELQAVYDRERTLMNHNEALRGRKRIDFTSVSKDCVSKILEPHKKKKKESKSGAAKSGASASASMQQPKQNKSPIIIISPSASSLINRANVSEFLEVGKLNPDPGSTLSAKELQQVTRMSTNLGGKMVFHVVDSPAKFKPEYWDRVVAVFVTGQAWQLNKYKWTSPNELFARVQGISVMYKNDPLPATLKSWNVQNFTLDRSTRFKDREVVEQIWNKIEKQALSMGFTPRKQ